MPNVPGQQHLIEDLRSSDWQTAVEAAEQLASYDGPEVTAALLAALDAPNTAITDAATHSLLARDDPATLEPMWTALRDLELDVTEQMWSVIDHMASRSTLARQLEERFRRSSAEPS